MAILRYGGGSGAIRLDDLRCNGFETSLFDCDGIDSKLNFSVYFPCYNFLLLCTFFLCWHSNMCSTSSL